MTDRPASAATPSAGVLSWGPLATRPRCLTDRGRTAVRLATIATGLQPEDEILVPAYCCGTEVAALVASGLRVRLFGVGIGLAIDPTRVAELVGPKTRAIYVIHYFGVAQPIEEIRRAARERGLAVIEDCALALFSEDANGVATGSLGDAAIFSFRKTLPWCRGGAFVGSLERLPPLTRQSEAMAVARRCRDAIATAVRSVRPRHPIEASASAAAAATDGPLPDIPASYYVRRDDPLLAMPRVLQRECASVDPKAERDARRLRWSWWQAELGDARSLRPLVPRLPDGCCPLSFPVLVDDRPSWLAALRAAGADLPPWWHGAMRGFDWAAFPDAVRMKGGVVPLPVDPALSERLFKRLATVAQSLAARGR